MGVSKAEELTEEAPRLEKWLKERMHGEMKYMEGHFESDLTRKLVPGTKSVVSLLFNYHNPEVNSREGEFKISQYAVGTDYHFVLSVNSRSF